MLNALLDIHNNPCEPLIITRFMVDLDYTIATDLYDMMMMITMMMMDEDGEYDDAVRATNRCHTTRKEWEGSTR